METNPQNVTLQSGTSNTILVVEAQRDVPLTKPEDIPFDPELPLPQIGGFTPDGAERSLRRRLGPVHQENDQSGGSGKH